MNGHEQETVGEELTKQFVFSSGRVVTLKPISPIFMSNADKAIEQNWIKEHGALPTPPTYEVLMGEGENAVVQEYEYDDESISDGTPEEQEAYQNYLEAINEYTLYTTTKTTEVMIRRGVEVDYPEGWEDDYLALGMEIPEDPYEKKIYYIENECVGVPMDYANLVQHLMNMTGIDPGLVEEALAGFRDNLQRYPDFPITEQEES